MRGRQDELNALISLMDRQYGQIREIETAWHIMGVSGDYRVRIEHYHDAVRAASNGESAEGKDSRLSAERLAYDVQMLRLIQAKPTTAGRAPELSPGAGLSTGGLVGSAPADMDRDTRAALKQLYKDYTVLFVALLAEKADRNADARTDEANLMVSDCAVLKEVLKQFAGGKTTMAQVLTAVEQLEHDELRRAVRQLLSAGTVKKEDVAQATRTLDQAQKSADAEVKKIDEAMHRFATTRLAVYEDSREVVKGMAARGMNIAGKFVETALRNQGGQGRGL